MKYSDTQEYWNYIRRKLDKIMIDYGFNISDNDIGGPAGFDCNNALLGFICEEIRKAAESR